MNMTLHATVMIYVQTQCAFVNYINEIRMLKRQWSEEKSFFFLNCVIHISSHRYAH